MSNDKTSKMGPMSLIAVNHLIWKRHLQRELTPYNISLKQYYILLELNRNGVLHPMQIAEMLFCDRPTVSVVVRNLTKHGWVKRKMDPENAKHVQVILTSRGREKLEEIQRSEKALKPKQDPLSCFSRSEITTLRQMLKRMHDHLLVITT